MMRFVAGKPLSMRWIARQKEAVAEFEKNGRSGRHSIDGMLLSAILNHCVATNTAFTLYFDHGFYVVKGALAEMKPPPLFSNNTR